MKRHKQSPQSNPMIAIVLTLLVIGAGQSQRGYALDGSEKLFPHPTSGCNLSKLKDTEGRQISAAAIVEDNKLVERCNTVFVHPRPTGSIEFVSFKEAENLASMCKEVEEVREKNIRLLKQYLAIIEKNLTGDPLDFIDTADQTREQVTATLKTYKKLAVRRGGTLVLSYQTHWSEDIKALRKANPRTKFLPLAFSKAQLSCSVPGADTKEHYLSSVPMTLAYSVDEFKLVPWGRPSKVLSTKKGLKYSPDKDSFLASFELSLTKACQEEEEIGKMSYQWSFGYQFMALTRLSPESFNGVTLFLARKSDPL